MPSVRDLLAGASQSDAPAVTSLEPSLEKAENQRGGESLELPQEEKQADSQAMAERIRKAMQLRVQLARMEVERREVEVRTQQERKAEITQQNIPDDEIDADLSEAQMRLNEARADLVRAEEAKHNTHLAASREVQATFTPRASKDATVILSKKPSIRDQLKSFFNRGDKGNDVAEKVTGPKL